MKITWLGQSGYLVEHDGHRLLIDPFLSDIVYKKQGIKRLVEPPLSVAKLRPDFLLISHDHLDHFDPEAVPQLHWAYPDCPVAGPESVIAHARALDIDESVLVHLLVGSVVETNGFGIRATPAYHSDPYAVGFLITVDEKLVYMTGDTLFTETLADEIKALANHPIDILFIVINGRLGNMNVEEAIEIAYRLQPKLAIPMHYGMFAENTEDPARFIEGCKTRQINAQALHLGQETIL